MAEELTWQGNFSGGRAGSDFGRGRQACEFLRLDLSSLPPSFSELDNDRQRPIELYRTHAIVMDLSL